MVNGTKVILRIDPNRFDGERITASPRFAVGGFIPDLEIDDLVEVVDPDGGRFLAQIEGFGGQSGTLIFLKVDLSSPLSSVEVEGLDPSEIASTWAPPLLQPQPA